MTKTDNKLTAADRCDACGAQAFTEVVMDNGGTLLFCGHHFNRHEDKLREVAFDINDFRKEINIKPSVSATV